MNTDGVKRFSHRLYLTRGAPVLDLTMCDGEVKLELAYPITN